MAYVQAPMFNFLEVGLLFCVIFHSLNGIRLVAIDFFGATEKHVAWFYVLMAIGAVLWIWGGSTMIGHAIEAMSHGHSFFPTT